MIRVEFSFDGGTNIYDSYDRYRWVYADSDDIMGAPMKDNEKTEFEKGRLDYTKKYYEESFDYKITFVANGADTNKDNAANSYLRKFMSDIHTDDEMNEITFYDKRKGVKIVGIYKDIKESDFHRSVGFEDCLKIELTLRVLEPQKCEFDYKPNN